MMLRPVYRWTLALVGFSYLQIASAVPPEAAEDARCFVAALAVMQSDSPTQAAAAYYYLGRLDGRESDGDLEELIAKVSRELSPGELRSESQRCGRQLATRGQLVVAIGRKLNSSNDSESK
jgi:hypothetical protein